MKLNHISIKVAAKDDAVSWASMLLRLDEETCFTMFQPKERSSVISKYEDKIISCDANSKSIILFATDNTLVINNIVGYLCTDTHKTRRKGHVTTMGIGILKAYHSQGIGSQLLNELLKHASNKQIKRIEAHVVDGNSRSINLLKKFGFVTEGIKQKSIYLEHEYRDEYLMALILDPG